MDKQQFDAIAKEVFAGLAEQNRSHLPAEDVTVPIVDEPIYGFAAADDPIFESFRDPVSWDSRSFPSRRTIPRQAVRHRLQCPR